LTNDPARSPTATQLVALVHVIAANRAFKLSVGLATIDHVLPFHRSINTLLWAELSMDSPTAKQ
jgi:acyl-CoA thioesterase